MDCFVNGGIFLRANGSISCGCDTGALTMLHEYEPDADYFTDSYMGKQYQRIRENLRNNRWPYNERICGSCALFFAEQEFKTGCAEHRVIETFHLEPSFACGLQCPSCLPRNERKNYLKKSPAGHLTLERHALDKVLGDLHRHGVTVNTFVLEGHGEPLYNRQVWEMIADIKRYFPSCGMRLITNCNAARFEPKMLTSGLDQIVFAIDGVDQETYAPYRIGGSFEKAFEFMRDFSQANAAAGSPVDTFWKYVVFNHNDQDEHLLRVQRLAKEVGVQNIMFILTRLGPVSKRIYEWDDIPLLKDGVPVTVETNVLTLEEFRKRLLDSCMQYLAVEPTEAHQIALCDLIARWIDADSHRQLKQYRVFRELLDHAAEVDRPSYERVAVIHDRLLQKGIFQLPEEVEVQLLAS